VRFASNRPLPEAITRVINEKLPLMDPPEVEYARSGDVAIAYQVVGEGPVDLVFVPFFGNIRWAGSSRCSHASSSGSHRFRA
jgi:hypothetical protein